jgi:hypothetical protein
MPDINSRLEILTGRGRMFLTDDLAIGQVELPKGWCICTSSIGGFNPQKVADKGCNVIAARGGQWLAMLGSEVFPHREGVLVGSGLLADLQGARGLAADDGTIGLVLDFQDGAGLRLLASNGSFVDVPDARVRGDQACVVSRSQAFWMEHGQPRTIGLPVPKVLPGPVYWPHVLAIHDRWWICYHSTDERGIVLHPVDSFDGYRITAPPAFYLAATVVDGKAALAWGLGADDERADSRVVDVATEPRVNLAAPPPPDRPVDPPTDPIDPPEEKPVPEPASLLPDVEAEYAKYQKPLKPEDYGTILNAVAWKNRAEGWGLSEKPQGNHVPAPHDRFDENGQRVTVWVAYDILHHQPSNTLWGCFNDNGPNWGLEDYHGDPNGRPWLAPVAPSGGDDGDPGDEDDGDGEGEPKPEPCKECVGLKSKVDELEELLLDMAKAADERFLKLENAKPPEMVLPALVARGTFYGLKIELPVVKK